MDAFEKWKPVNGYGESSLDAIAEQAFRAGMRAAAALLKARDELAYRKIKDFAEQEKVPMDENKYLLGRGDEAHGAYVAILAEADK